jgi:hypothetical protein
VAEFEEKSLLIAGLGTSLTARGAWLDRDPVELEPIVHRPARVMIFASVGATSRMGLTVVDEVARARPDIAIIEFASNDAALHRRVSLTRSAANVAAIIRRLRAAGGEIHLYLMTMGPDHGASRPFCGSGSRAARASQRREPRHDMATPN